MRHPWEGSPVPSKIKFARGNDAARNVANRDGNGLLLADQHDQLLASGDAGIEQVL